MSAAIHSGWPANWLQPVWCNKAHYYANPASSCDSKVVCFECEGERRKRDNQKSVRLREREQMNGRLSVWSQCICVRACLSHWEACNTKAAASRLSSALTTLLVIGMTFENILTEDKRLNIEWVDLSTAKQELKGWESTLETMGIEALRICNLPISLNSVLALAFQGESWKNPTAFIRG